MLAIIGLSWFTTSECTNWRHSSRCCETGSEGVAASVARIEVAFRREIVAPNRATKSAYSRIWSSWAKTADLASAESGLFAQLSTKVFNLAS